MAINLKSYRERVLELPAEPHSDPILVPPPKAREILGGMSARWLWGATKAGLIKHVRCGRRVMYDVADLRAFVEENKSGGGS